jgi:plastocyanin domain-containing protein
MKISALLVAGLSLTTVLSAQAKPADHGQGPQVKPQKVTITLPNDYREGAATVKAGKPVALTFFLKSEAGCGDTIAVPDAKWKKDLTVGKSATVVYTPKKSGTLNYECGMGHMKGSVIVK